MTSWTTARQAPLSFSTSRSLFRFMSIQLVMLSNHLILYHPFLLLPSVFPIIRVFFNESSLQIRRPKYWSFGFSISPSNEHSGLISFRIDWLDLLAVQGTLKRHQFGTQPSLWSSSLKNSYHLQKRFQPSQNEGQGCQIPEASVANRHKQNNQEEQKCILSQC